MLTEEEETKMGALLTSSSTPKSIKDLLHTLVKCKKNVTDSKQRLAYLEGLAKTILQTPESKLETVSYIPDACPPVPQLIPCNEPTEYPVPAEIQGILYKGALESGLQLLTPMEASAMLQGIKVGSSKDKDQLLAIILMISIGQRIREQKQT